MDTDFQKWKKKIFFWTTRPKIRFSALMCGIQTRIETILIDFLEPGSKVLHKSKEPLKTSDQCWVGTNLNPGI